MLDMYSRENLKKRPDFSPQERLSPAWKEQVHQFFKKEEENPQVLSAYAEYNARQMELYDPCGTSVWKNDFV